MNGIKKILYLGKDDDFYDKLKSYGEKYIKDGHSLNKIVYGAGELTEFLCNEGANIVFVDLSDMDNTGPIVEEIIFIKKIRKFRPILFVAILSDVSNKKDQILLFSSGFQLVHIKGGEEESLITDAFCIGFGVKIPVPQYAKAKNINLELKVGLCSTLTSISLENFHIESDLNTTSEKLNLAFDLFKDLKLEAFKVKSHLDLPAIYPMTDHYCLEYPFAGPWEPVTDESIQVETVETWLDLNKEKLLKKRGHILIISNNNKIYRPLYERQEKISFLLHLNNKIDNEDIKKEISQTKPGLVFFEINEEEGNSIGAFCNIVEKIKEISNYNPILVTFNNPSKAEALKKICNYDNIISIPSEFNLDIFELFVKGLTEKKKSKISEDVFYFRMTDPLRVIDVYQEVYITSLTEHEMTFISKNELPMFSILHLYLPVDCFLIVVPPSNELENSVIGTHYLGLIHGISEKDRQILRTFIYQIIYSPIKEFTNASVEAALKRKNLDDENTKNEEKEMANKVAKKESKEKTEDVINYKTFVRQDIKGKSKL